MAFQSTVRVGSCPRCCFEFDAFAHLDQPLNRRCSQVWVATQKKKEQIPICPNCRINVTSFETTEEAFIRMSEHCDLESENNILAQAQPVGSELPPQSYPGLQAIFTVVEDHWNRPFDTNTPLCRRIILNGITITPLALLEKLCLLGYRDGHIAIQIEFKKDCGFESYLRARQIIPYAHGFHTTANPEETKALFRIVFCNNEISAFDQVVMGKICEIVERGACTPIAGNPEDFIRTSF
jgi:hypothetical protein